MFVTPIYRLLAAAVIAAGVTTTHAAEEQVDLQHVGDADSTNSVESAPKTPFLLERLDSKFIQRADEVFTDQLHPFNAMKWSIQFDQNSERFHDRTASAAQRALGRSVEYGIRDTIVDLPVMHWLEERQEFLADLLRDSVSGVEEESVAPLAGSYDYAEQAWWQSVSNRRKVRYGVRPFNTSPYSFMSYAFRDRERLLFLGHLRYYYDHFSDHRFEVAVSVPLMHGFSMGMGTSYQLGREEKQRAGLKVFKEFNRTGIIHLGCELRDRPTLLGGISFLW
jgi:hypothetical protein